MLQWHALSYPGDNHLNIWLTSSSCPSQDYNFFFVTSDFVYVCIERYLSATVHNYSNRQMQAQSLHALGKTFFSGTPSVCTQPHTSNIHQFHTHSDFWLQLGTRPLFCFLHILLTFLLYLDFSRYSYGILASQKSHFCSSYS